MLLRRGLPIPLWRLNARRISRVPHAWVARKERLWRRLGRQALAAGYPRHQEGDLLPYRAAAEEERSARDRAEAAAQVTHSEYLAVRSDIRIFEDLFREVGVRELCASVPLSLYAWDDPDECPGPQHGRPAVALP